MPNCRLRTNICATSTLRCWPHWSRSSVSLSHLTNALYSALATKFAPFTVAQNGQRLCASPTAGRPARLPLMRVEPGYEVRRHRRGDRRDAMKRQVLAWHFVGAALRDGRPVPPDGEWLVHEGDVEPRISGLHASRKVIDALNYAPGSTICRVVVADVVVDEGDKLVARRRAILWRVDADDVLRQFARQAALSVIHLWDAP